MCAVITVAHSVEIPVYFPRKWQGKRRKINNIYYTNACKVDERASQKGYRNGF